MTKVGLGWIAVVWVIIAGCDDAAQTAAPSPVPPGVTVGVGPGGSAAGGTMAVGGNGAGGLGGMLAAGGMGGAGGLGLGGAGGEPTAMPDFSLLDVNPTSPRYDQAVSPRDYLMKVSGWYFGHAT